MDTFVLHLKREPAFTCAAVPTMVLIDGSLRASLKVTDSQNLILPRKPVKVDLVSQIFMGKDEHECSITIDPQDHIEVTLSFTYKSSLKGLLKLKTFYIQTNIIYGPKLSVR